MAREVRLHDCDYLYAPASGGDTGAQQATLTIMVGGPEAAFKRALPIFKAMGKTILLFNLTFLLLLVELHRGKDFG